MVAIELIAPPNPIDLASSSIESTARNYSNVILLDSTEPTVDLIEGLTSTAEVSNRIGITSSEINKSTDMKMHSGLHGKVVGIIRRNCKQYAGSVDPNSEFQIEGN